jgi:hypothetical protein
MVQLKPFSWQRMIDAVEAVRKRLLKATAALESAEIPYAVVGGNAVAAWVARIDRAAVRNTQDVDILIRRSDFDRVKEALQAVGFHHRFLFGIDCFLDDPNSHPRDAVHILYACEKVKPGDFVAAPDVTESEPAEDHQIIMLNSLVQMKLNAFRDKDRMHLRDMLDIGLIDQSWTARFPVELAARLQELIDNPE